MPFALLVWAIIIIFMANVALPGFMWVIIIFFAVLFTVAVLASYDDSGKADNE